ncbi:MAG: acetyl-CoA C-acetyltransferase [Candidatus Thermoplasmatota archaeon]|nr:acetyl-CoA C-acetyltransferase [Candidatus Thermoplasmatota archaeon]
MEECFIISAKRTPIGKFGKAFAKTRAVELGGVAINESIKSAGVQPEQVEHVIMGNVIQAGNGQNPAGQSASLAGLPPTVTKYTVNTVCASGMLAIEDAARQIWLGEKGIVVAGGMESMSGSPFMMSSELRWGPKQLLFKNYKIEDSMLKDGLLDAFYFEHMGVSAENTGKKYGLTREKADEFSVRSQSLALEATEKGKFNDELIAMDQLKKDEGIRKTGMEDLRRLVPAFDRNGILTAGNSSQLSDGASALVLASGRSVKELGLKPIAKIVGYEMASLDSRDFVEAPIPSTKKLMERMNVNIDHFDLVEHNEAFSVASIIVRDELKIEDSRFNVNGGAIAIGHPLGNSGSRIVVTLLHALRNNKLKNGLATLCHGGGGAHSMAIELV